MTEQEFYENVRQTINDRINSDKQIKSFREKLAKGKATMQETVNQNSHIANLIGVTLSDFMPDAKSGEGLREYVCREILKDQHIDTNEMLADVQRIIDSKTGVDIEPQTAPFPKERVEQAAHSLEDPTVDIDVIQRRARSVTENIINSYADDYVKENAKFRSDAGLKCYITRYTSGSCCKWCDSIAGRYEYGEEPDDVYRRHDNCDCVVTFESGRTRQDVWSKKSWEVPETDKTEYKPQVLSREQSKALEAENMQFKGIDKSGESGIIKLNRSINRKEKNIGAFSNLEISMHKKSVMQICKKYSIDTKGLTLKIQRSEKMLSMPFYGSTDYDNIGRIDLFPNAFINEEQLVRTIIHEKCHVLQLQKYGKKYTQTHLNYMEKQAYRFENIFYTILRKRV